jgi:glycosyltransferase involved in cell wall biosynthesis
MNLQLIIGYYFTGLNVKMNVLRVISSVNKANGGPINGLLNSSNELIKRGWEVEVLSLDDPSLPHTKNFPMALNTYKSSYGPLKYSKEFREWLVSNVTRFDVVIIHGIWQYHSYCTAQVCKELNVPYVLFTHGMLDPWFTKTNIVGRLKKTIYWKLFEKHTVNNASRVLFTSQEELRLARQPFAPYSPVEQVIAYGSPLPLVKEDCSKKAFFNLFPNLDGQPFLLFLSRIHEKKGIDILIEAMGELRQKHPGMRLAIAGPDHNNLKQKLHKRAVLLGIDDQISWLGMLDGDVKWGAFYACEAFVLPSHQENFGIVVAEALSTGTPVLITNKVNIWREIESAGAGLVENDDVEGITKLLNQCFTLTPDEKRDMADKAKNCYQNNFSIESAVTDLEIVLLDVISSANANES